MSFNVNVFNVRGDRSETSIESLTEQVKVITVDRKILSALLFEFESQHFSLFSVHKTVLIRARGKGPVTITSEMRDAFNRFVKQNQFHRVMEACLRIFKESERILTPFDVCQYLWSVYGITCIPDDKRTQITFHLGATSFSVPLVRGWPSFPNRFTDHSDYEKFSKMINGASITVLPFIPQVYEVMTIIFSVFKLVKGEDRRNGRIMAPRGTDHLRKLFPEGSDLIFGATSWHSSIITMIDQFFLSDAFKNEMVDANKNDVAQRLYRGLFALINHFAAQQMDAVATFGQIHKAMTSMMYSNTLFQDTFNRRVLGPMGKDGNKFARAQLFMEQCRGVRGTDASDISALTRNFHMVPCLPDACSTVEKWIAPATVAKELDHSRIIYAGCSPGNALPMLHSMFPKHIKNAKRNALLRKLRDIDGGGFGITDDDLRQIDKYKLTINDELAYPEIIFLDSQACTRTDAYRWEQKDLFSYPIKPNDVVLSDIWVDADGDHLRKFNMNIISYVLNLFLNPVYFCVKVNLRIVGLKQESIPDDPMPDDWYRLFAHDKFKARTEVSLYFTKCGRPHNTEYYVSNFTIKKWNAAKCTGSFNVKSLDDLRVYLSARATISMLANYHRTVFYLYKDNRHIDFDDYYPMTLENFPVFVKPEVLKGTAVLDTYVANYRDDNIVPGSDLASYINGKAPSNIPAPISSHSSRSSSASSASSVSPGPARQVNPKFQPKGKVHKEKKNRGEKNSKKYRKRKQHIQESSVPLSPPPAQPMAPDPKPVPKPPAPLQTVNGPNPSFSSDATVSSDFLSFDFGAFNSAN